MSASFSACADAVPWPRNCGMMSSLKIGTAASRRVLVDQDRTISFMGEDLRVYATPEIVWDAEMLCRDLFLEHLETGNDSVGVRVELDHIAAGIAGSEVEIVACVRGITGRRVAFDLTVRDGIEIIASGRHERIAVSLAATFDRIVAKRGRLALAGMPRWNGDITQPRG